MTELSLAPVPSRQPWWVPSSLGDAMEMAKLLATSDMVPKDYKGRPANILLAIQYGAEIGLGALAALQNIACIGGRPCLWGDALLAVCQGHPLWAGHKEGIDKTGKADDWKAVCLVRRFVDSRRLEKDEQTVEFSVADAKRAQLWGKAGPWQQYPQRMLLLRARAFALRNLFADALRGIASAEEIQDLETVKSAQVSEVPQTGIAGFMAKLSEQPKPEDEVIGPGGENPLTDDVGSAVHPEDADLVPQPGDRD